MSVIGQAAGIAHGTMKGFRQHRYRQIDPCDACIEACREHARAERGTKRDGVRPLTEAQRAWHGSPRRLWDGPSVSRDITQAAPPLSEGTIPGRDLVVGDVIVHLGVERPVDRIEPYTGSLLAELGVGTRVAWSGDWGMTIGPDAAIRTLPRPAEVSHAS